MRTQFSAPPPVTRQTHDLKISCLLYLTARERAQRGWLGPAVGRLRESSHSHGVAKEKCWYRAESQTPGWQPLRSAHRWSISRGIRAPAKCLASQVRSLFQMGTPSQGSPSKRGPLHAPRPTCMGNGGQSQYEKGRGSGGAMRLGVQRLVPEKNPSASQPFTDTPC